MHSHERYVYTAQHVYVNVSIALSFAFVESEMLHVSDSYSCVIAFTFAPSFFYTMASSIGHIYNNPELNFLNEFRDVSIP